MNIIKVNLVLLFVCASALTSASLIAAEKVDSYTYVGADLGFMSANTTAVSISTTIFRSKIGIKPFPKMKPRILLEAHIGFDIAGEEVDYNGQSFNVELDSFVGSYARVEWDLSSKAAVYGLLGFAAAQMEGDYTLFGNGVNDDTKKSSSSFSYGFGAHWKTPYNLRAVVEYISVVSGSGKLVEVNGFTIGIVKDI